MGKTINKHIHIDEDHWKRIEKAAHERGISPSRFMISAALEGREWPRAEAEIHLLRPLYSQRRPSSATWKGPDARKKSSKSVVLFPNSRRNCREYR